MRIVVHLSDYGWPVPAEALPACWPTSAAWSRARAWTGWPWPTTCGSTRSWVAPSRPRSRPTPRSPGWRPTPAGCGCSPWRPGRFRHPGVLAKTVTTLDVLSGERAWLGIGAGHYQEVRRVGRAVALHRHPLRPAGGRPRGVHPDVVGQSGRGRALRRASRAGRAAAQPAPGRHPAAAWDPGSRHRRAPDPAAGRPLRRRLQPAARPGDRPPPRRAASGLRRRRHRLRPHRAHLRLRLRPPTTSRPAPR